MKKQPSCNENNYNIVVIKTMTFNTWLYEKRKAARLTQGELAKRANISTSYVSTLERSQPHTVTGAQPQPAIDVVEALAKALQVDIDEARLAAGYAPLKPKKSDTAGLLRAIEGIDPERKEFAIKQIKAIIRTYKDDPNFDFDYVDD